MRYVWYGLLLGAGLFVNGCCCSWPLSSNAAALLLAQKDTSHGMVQYISAEQAAAHR